MRKTILAALAAASFTVPAVAFAMPPRDTTVEPSQLGQNGMQDNFLEKSQKVGPLVHPNQFNTSLGGGMVGGNEPGHPDSPGNTKIDPESRAPINDVQPGRGTDDTRQSANPPPAR